jgi:hypothetical protein
MESYPRKVKGILGEITADLQSHVYSHVGPSGVRALPLAAGINVGAHYKWHFLFLSSLQLIANSPRRSYRRVLKFYTGS